MSLAFRSLQPAAEIRWDAFASSNRAPQLRALRDVLARRLARVEPWSVALPLVALALL